MGPALLLLLASASPDASGIAWIKDDWAAAQKAAIAQHKPIAVDVWATWCHTCLSMKTTILTQPPLAKVKDQLVWLALDYDLPKNADFFARYPINAFPTFLVIDAQEGAVLGRLMGSGTPVEMAQFFGTSAAGGTQALEASQRALAKQDYAGAIELSDAALKNGAELTPYLRTRLLLGWIEGWWKLNPKKCASEGFQRFNQVDQSSQGLDYLSMVADCASELPAAEQAPIMSAVRDRFQKALADPKVELSADDRSSAYSILADAQAALGDQAGAKESQKQRLAGLEAAAKAAKSPVERSAFDDHRTQLYLQLERYADAEAMLKASEKAMPKDFNPPWRLAIVYLKQKKVAPGLQAIDRALKNGYGARKMRLYSTKIDLLLEAKKPAEAQATLTAARAELKKLPASVIRASWVDELESRAAKIPAPATPPASGKG